MSESKREPPQRDGEKPEARDADVDASEDSFPASDPPSYARDAEQDPRRDRKTRVDGDR